MKVAKFNSVYDNTFTQFDLPWEDLSKRLTQHKEYSKKEDAPLFSFVEYRKPSADAEEVTQRVGLNTTEVVWSDGVITNEKMQTLRRNVNVLSVHGLVLDFDCGVSPLTIAKHFINYKHVIYSTYSSTPTHPKFRVVLPFAEPISPEDYKSYWLDLFNSFEEDMRPDASCKDASRMMYFPSCAKDALDTVFHHINDAEELFDITKVKPIKRTKPATPNHVGDTTRGALGKGDYSTLDAVAWFKAKGLYIKEHDTSGKHYVKCPFASGHTGGKQGDTDTVLWQEDGKWPTFHCSHNHCSGKGITDVIRELGDADDFCGRMFNETMGVTRITYPEPVDRIRDVEAPQRVTIAEAECEPVGFDDEHYYYMNTATKQISKLKANSHTKSGFFGVVPNILYWQNLYFDGKRINWDNAACDMMSRCQERGYYNPKSTRGLGVWKDNNRTVVHYGSHLYVDGVRMGIRDIKSRYLYENAVEPIPDLEPLPQRDLIRIAELAQRFPFNNPTDYKLLSGMVVIGALSSFVDWRPHLWITGDQGSGKSQVITRFLGRLWEPLGAASFEGTTTAAGIRQHVRNNGLPIMIDESEASSRREHDRVNALIELARSASTESTAVVAKGTQQGFGMNFTLKNCFVFCSISHALTSSQDLERFTVLSFRKTLESRDKWPQLKKDLEILTDEFSYRFFANVTKAAPVIQRNAEKIYKKIVKHVDTASSRWADQYSILLAGYYHITNGGEISDEDAWEISKEVDLTEQLESAPETASYVMLSWIKSYIIKGEVVNSGDRIEKRELSVGEMLYYTIYREDSQIYVDLLSRFGIGYSKTQNAVLFASRHEQLQKIFAEGGYLGYAQMLRLIKDARNITARLGPDKARNCVAVPVEAFGY